MEYTNEYKEAIAAFHLMWDGFPGVARLIDRKNQVIAVNPFAEQAGLEAGQLCVQAGSPESHRGCRKAAALKERTGQVDRPAEEKVRGWLPIEGYPDLVVHFSLRIPEKNK